MGYGIWLVILGVLGAANLIIAKRPDAADAIAKLTPYQGWIGALSALGGVIGIVMSILGIGLLSIAPILWITSLGGAVLQAALGLLLGVGVIKSFIKDPAAQAKMDETIAKLAPKQGVLGLVAIAFGIWVIVANVLFTAAAAAA